MASIWRAFLIAFVDVRKSAVLLHQGGLSSQCLDINHHRVFGKRSKSFASTYRRHLDVFFRSKCHGPPKGMHVLDEIQSCYGQKVCGTQTLRLLHCCLICYRSVKVISTTFVLRNRNVPTFLVAMSHGYVLVARQHACGITRR